MEKLISSMSANCELSILHVNGKTAVGFRSTDMKIASAVVDYIEHTTTSISFITLIDFQEPPKGD